MIRVLSVGCVTPLGDDPRAVAGAVRAGRSALAPLPALAHLPDDRAAVVAGPDLGPWLRRRKDARLLARAAALAMPAAGKALAACPVPWDPETLGLYVAVGREPPDEGEAEPSMVAMHADGALDLMRLGTDGRALYPPLLPLRTLPNMILAHVSIQHGIRGENGTCAGDADAGRQALRAAILAVREGRAPLALVGAAYSAVDLASARDRWREGTAEGCPPGEAAVFAVVGVADDVPGVSVEDVEGADWSAHMGDCGPVAGLWGLVRAWGTLA